MKKAASHWTARALAMICWGTMAGWGIAQCMGNAAIASKPNVILILTDDQGYGDMSCHGNPWLPTPEIDRLFHDAVRLTDCHVDPTCSPTRAALMTGRYSSRTGVWLTYGSRHHLRKDEVTMANIFQEGGYRTAIFGKWHLGDNYPFRPNDRGFEESLVHGGGVIGETPDHWGNDYYDDVYLRNGSPERAKGYCTDVWFDEAIRYVDRHRNQPFFIYLPTNAPHGPLHVPQKYAEAFREKPQVPESRRPFYGMIANIDENIGRLRAHLSKLELDRNTIIVFMNDNGTGHGVTLVKDGKPNRGGWAAAPEKQGGFNAGMRGRKASAYEGGHRAACFIHWPGGGISGGRDVNGLTAHFDIMPTLMDLCELKTNPTMKLDGISLAKPLRSPEVSVPSRTLFVHHQGRFGTPVGDGLPIFRKDFAVMDGRWRLVGEELYDLEADPGQRTDVAEDHPDIRDRLDAEYVRWWEDTSEQFETPNPFEIDPAKQRVVTITSQNLLGGKVAYSQHHVRSASSTPGWTWVDVKKPGRYRITLRRWPKETDHAMSEVVPGHELDPSRHHMKNSLVALPSKSIPVREVRFRLGDDVRTVSVKPADRQAELMVQLESGVHTIEGTLVAEGGDEFPVYYMYIEPE